MREYFDRGASQLGRYIVLGCQCLNAAGTPSVPTACPTMTIYNSAGTAVVTRLIPVQDKFRRSGLFRYRQFLTSDFSAGRYWVTYDYVVSAYTGEALDTFEVLPGGDADGQFLSLYAFRRPVGRLMFGQTDGGKLFLARNPKT